jgi:hypothetical protein
MNEEFQGVREYDAVVVLSVFGIVCLVVGFLLGHFI